MKLALRIWNLVDRADVNGVELTANEIKSGLKGVPPASIAAELTRMVEAKELRKRRPKVKRGHECFVYPPGRGPGEEEQRGRPVPAFEGFMARKRRLAKEAKRRAL